MDSQNFCLKWDNFRASVTSVFDALRNDGELVDITLCSEGRSVKAHRMMLSACSPFFRELLKDNPCQHPVFILKDTAFEDLAAVVEFVYRGQVNVLQTRLASFIQTAEMLQIRGLSGEEEENQTAARPPRRSAPPPAPSPPISSSPPAASCPPHSAPSASTNAYSTPSLHAGSPKRAHLPPPPSPRRKSSDPGWIGTPDTSSPAPNAKRRRSASPPLGSPALAVAASPASELPPTPVFEEVAVKNDHIKVEKLELTQEQEQEEDGGDVEAALDRLACYEGEQRCSAAGPQQMGDAGPSGVGHPSVTGDVTRGTTGRGSASYHPTTWPVQPPLARVESHSHEESTQDSTSSSYSAHSSTDQSFLQQERHASARNWSSGPGESSALIDSARAPQTGFASPQSWPYTGQASNASHQYANRSVASPSVGRGFSSATKEKCNICGGWFSKGSSMSQHRALHRGDTTCAVCGRVYSTKCNLKAHMREVHGLGQPGSQAYM